MKIYKIASHERYYEALKQTLKYVFDALEKEWGVAAQWDRTYSHDVSIEKHDPSGIQGDAWIQAYHDRFNFDGYQKSHINVNKYYDSEFMQDEYGRSIDVDIDINNPQMALQNVKNAIQRMDV